MFEQSKTKPNSNKNQNQSQNQTKNQNQNQSQKQTKKQNQKASWCFSQRKALEEPLDTSDKGYQPPIDESMVKEFDPEDQGVRALPVPGGLISGFGSKRWPTTRDQRLFWSNFFLFTSFEPWPFVDQNPVRPKGSSRTRLHEDMVRGRGRGAGSGKGVGEACWSKHVKNLRYLVWDDFPKDP